MHRQVDVLPICELQTRNLVWLSNTDTAMAVAAILSPIPMALLCHSDFWLLM